MSRPPDQARQPQRLQDRLAAPGDRRVADMLRTAGELERLQRLTEQALKDPVLEFQLTGMVGDSLRLQVATAAMATRLRYQQRRLLKIVAELSGRPLRRVEVRIAPRARPATPPAAAPPLGISRDAAAQLRSLAEDEADPSLRQALQRLATRAEERDGQ